MNNDIVIAASLALVAFIVLWYTNRRRVLLHEHVFKNRNIVIYNLRRLTRVSYLTISIGDIRIVREKLMEVATLERKLVCPDNPAQETLSRNRIIANLCECMEMYTRVGVPHRRFFQMID